jgi:hypothetical protein
VLVRYDKVTRAIACEKCPSENIINAGLLKVKRSFPCDVRITDSQYTYMYLPLGTEITLEENLPYFAKMQKSGVYYGTSGVAKAKNRYCREHFLETTTEASKPTPPETSASSTETSASKAEASSTSPKSTVGTTKVTTAETSAVTLPPKTTEGAGAKDG